MVTYDYQADLLYHASPTQFSQLLNYADIFIDVYIDREKERKRERERKGRNICTISRHTVLKIHLWLLGFNCIIKDLG